MGSQHPAHMLAYPSSVHHKVGNRLFNVAEERRSKCNKDFVEGMPLGYLREQEAAGSLAAPTIAVTVGASWPIHPQRIAYLSHLAKRRHFIFCVVFVVALAGALGEGSEGSASDGRNENYYATL